MDNFEKVLTNLGFPPTINVQDQKSISQHFQAIKKCGIYILHFSNSEIYVGQAVDITRRYIQHRKNYNDIVKISFKCVLANDLDKEEKHTIEFFEQRGFHLRNIVYTTTSYTPSPFDELMPPDEQVNWLNSNNHEITSDIRINDLDIRRKYQTRYKRFLTMPKSSEVIDVLRKYVKSCVPAYREGEMYYWSCTCPLEKRPNNMVVYSRININWQEVFTIGTQNDQLFFSWHLANSPIRISWDKKNFYRPSIYKTLTLNGARLNSHKYIPGGSDQINLLLEGNIDRAFSIMDDPHVLYAIKSFNLNLTRKGTNSHYQNHCFELADNFFI
jgi:hypothetical protein